MAALASDCRRWLASVSSTWLTPQEHSEAQRIAHEGTDEECRAEYDRLIHRRDDRRDLWASSQ